MRLLRAGCPWKAEQTHRSLARYLLEETYETLEAIDVGEATGDFSHLREELGDVLLQVYFHAVVAEERGDFTLADVAADIVDKMRRRNQHVLGTTAERAAVTDAAGASDAWQAAKAGEGGRAKKRSSPLEELPPGLPALLAADKVLERLERAGRPLAVEAPADPVPAPSAASPIGDRLLALVAEARASGLDPEQELRDALRRQLQV